MIKIKKGGICLTFFREFLVFLLATAFAGNLMTHSETPSVLMVPANAVLFLALKGLFFVLKLKMARHKRFPSLLNADKSLEEKSLRPSDSLRAMDLWSILF